MNEYKERFTSNERLLRDALGEIAEYIGDSPTNPISLSLLCLDFDIDFEEKCKIFDAFRKVITNYKFEDLSIDLFRKELVEFVPKTESFSDLTIVRFIKAYSRHMITELYPYACLAESELDLD